MNRRTRRALVAKGGVPEPKKSGDKWIPLQRAEPIPPSEQQIAEQWQFGREHGFTDEQILAALTNRGELWKNDRYQVEVKRMKQFPDLPPMVQLSIKRLDQKPIHDWRDLQRIKNELVGEQCEGVELYPAEDRLVDTANQYFLTVVTDPTFRFPWGFQQRLVSEDSSGGAVQRPFDNDSV